MSSPDQINAARRNGAKSHGPTSPVGKRNSSRNALRHGLLAQCVVLENESRDLFRKLIVGFDLRFGPADSLEQGIVEEMAAAAWRLRRAWAIETNAINRAMHAAETNHSKSRDMEDAAPDQITRLSLGWDRLANQSQELHLVQRYETRLHRMFQRALKTLQLVKNANFPNEPSKSLETKTDAENPTSETGP